VPGTRAPTALGIVPHQIRGGVFDLRQRLFAAPAFPKCVACSAVVCEAFVKDEGSKAEFLRRAFDDPSYLENATGLTAMKEAVDDDVGWLSDDSGGDDF
jgi:ubiquitin-like modifier-activating enzyme ATG7